MRGYGTRCETCHQGHEACQEVPLLGYCCPNCIELLSRPMSVDLCVEGESILSLAELYDLEFRSRKESLRAKARIVVIQRNSDGEDACELPEASAGTV